MSVSHCRPLNVDQSRDFVDRAEVELLFVKLYWAHESSEIFFVRFFCVVNLAREWRFDVVDRREISTRVENAVAEQITKVL